MSTWVAFLRGMNLGGRRITNEELCAHFEGLGLENVRAFQASGNVLFETEASDRAALVSHIEKGLAAALEYEVPTFLRDAREVRAIAAHRPFDEDLRATGRKVQVALLSRPASPEARDSVQARGSDADLLICEEREIYWAPLLGVGRSELDWKAIEKLVGPVTVRTQGTMQRIAARLGD